MEINFLITEALVNDMDSVEYEAFERAQDGDIKMYRLRPAICRFMVDENNKPVPHAQALRISDKMKVKQMKEFVEKFFSVMKGAAVPNEKGSLSKSPIEVEATASELQPG